MPQRNINFSDYQNKFIDRMIDEGIYENASELVHSAMHQFQEEQERKEMEWVQHLRVIGEKALASVERGEGIDISTPDDRQRVFDEIRNRAMQRAEKKTSREIIMYSYWLSPQAETSLEDIYFRGYSEFGQRIADEYDILIRHAIADICENPERTGSRPVPGKEDGLRWYPILLSKRRAGVNIKHPKHEVLYYFLKDQKIVVIADVLRGCREAAYETIEREKIMKQVHPDSE